MIRKYGREEAANNVPRLIISIELYGQGLEIGFNEHYSLDTPIAEALSDFFMYVHREDRYKIDLSRSKLRLDYVDLPKSKEVTLLIHPDED